MAAQTMRGVFPIMITPFDAKDRIDEDSLRRAVEYNIDAGVHGFGVAFATEIPKLTEAERLRVAAVIIDQARGRVPVVVNTGAPSTHATLLYSRQAEDLGAGAVINKDVPDYALVVGVPGKQIGWMSEFGEQLDLPLSGEGKVVCEHTGAVYTLSGQTVRKSEAA